MTRYTVEDGVPKGQIVDPDGSQPRYSRGAHNNTKSSDLKSYRQCVAREMEGASGDRGDIQESFQQAASNCS